MNQATLAREAGVTQAAISNLETDNSRKPSAPTLLRLAAVLDANPQWILDGEGDPHTWRPVTADAHVELIGLFNSMDDMTKLTILAAARAMAKK